MKPITHITAATRKRAENFKRIITAFGYREMMAEDIAELIGHTVGSARKMARELLGAEVIELSRVIDSSHGGHGIPIYRLAMKGDELAAFLLKLDEPDLMPIMTAKGPAGFHFHATPDDRRTDIHAWEKVVGRHDALHRAFFGAGV